MVAKRTRVVGDQIGGKTDQSVTAATSIAAVKLTGWSDRDAAILDAVREIVIRTGTARATVQQVADAAGISRMTFYRAMGSYDNALLLALTREFQHGTAEIVRGSAQITGRERLLEFLDAVIRAFADSEFIRTVRTSSPEILMPYLSERLGRGQQTVLELINGLLSDGKRDGSIRADAVTGIAILMTVHGMALGSPILRGSGAFEQTLHEFGAMVESALLPADDQLATAHAADGVQSSTSELRPAHGTVLG